MPSEESGKDSRWVISDVWWGLEGVGVMRSFKANGWHTHYWTSKSVTVNDEFDMVKILRVCLFHWMVFNNEMEFLCLCTINLLEYDCLQRWVVLNYSTKPQQPDRKCHQSQTCVFNGFKYTYIIWTHICSKLRRTLKRRRKGVSIVFLLSLNFYYFRYVNITLIPILHENLVWWTRYLKGNFTNNEF